MAGWVFHKKVPHFHTEILIFSNGQEFALPQCKKLERSVLFFGTMCRQKGRLNPVSTPNSECFYPCRIIIATLKGPNAKDFLLKAV
jgi:hypothetical protein